MTQQPHRSSKIHLLQMFTAWSLSTISQTMACLKIILIKTTHGRSYAAISRSMGLFLSRFRHLIGFWISMFKKSSMKLEKSKLMLFHNMSQAKIGSSKQAKTSFGKSSLGKSLSVSTHGCSSSTIDTSQCFRTNQESETWHTQQSFMRTSPFPKRKWMIIMKKILRLKWERKKSRTSWRNTKRRKFSLEKCLWCFAPNSANSKSSMRCREWKMERTARLTKEGTSSLMVRRKSLLPKREWETIKSMSLPKNLLPSTHGWQRFDRRPKLQTDRLSCSPCKWNRVKEEKLLHQVLEKTHQFIAPSLWFGRAFLSSFCSVL